MGNNLVLGIDNVDFVKVISGHYARIPIGAVGKIMCKTQVMGLIQVDVADHGECRLWQKNLIKITKKEYFIKALQGTENDK